MKTIKELEEGCNDKGLWYTCNKDSLCPACIKTRVILKDVLGLIDERYAGHGILCTCAVCEYRRELKKRIEG